jgi:hypothetical protein
LTVGHEIAYLASEIKVIETSIEGLDSSNRFFSLGYGGGASVTG